MSISQRLKSAWNVLTDESPERESEMPSMSNPVMSYSTSPNRLYINTTRDKDIIAAILTRLAIDVASVDIRHSRLDDQGRYSAEIDSGLNSCLSLEANIDQGARAFRQNIASMLFEKGVAAIVPVDITNRPTNYAAYDILTMRVGEIVAWYPQHVRVKLYNDRTGQIEEVMVSKRYAAVVENPLYSVMNEPNSTLRRLVRKLALLDAVDEQSSSGKMDLIIQLPYVVKSEARRQQAEQRRKDIEMQLRDGTYGIAYTDGTERITQLNRPVENNLMGQIEFLTKNLYSELGLTPEVFDGTASEEVMLNYYARTIDPVLQSISEAMKRTFLTKTARSQGQSIEYFRQPFKIVPVAQLAELADKFTRNEVLSSNEVRSMIGFKPSSDPKADMLQNKNVPNALPIAPLPTDPSIELEPPIEEIPQDQ